MYEFGERMYRARLRRENPGAADTEIEARVRVWRATRHGAPGGDSNGSPSRRFE
jgi:hypothetical protein